MTTIEVMGAREEVLLAALNLAHSRLWAELHPEDAHGADSIDLAGDLLDEALGKWTRSRRAVAEGEMPPARVGTINVDGPKSIEEMQAEVNAYCIEKGWAGPGAPGKTFGDCMALLHSEVSEALEAYRVWGTADATKPVVRTINDAADDLSHAAHGWKPQSTSLPKPEGVGSEFADVLIRLLDDCERFGVDLQFEYERKMAYNRTRAYQHGGKSL